MPSVALTTQQITDLIAECIGNAHDLYHSGIIVHYQGITTIARALLISSVEEYGKIGWLYRALMLPDDAPEEWVRWWDRFQSHNVKNKVGRMMLAQGDGLMPLLARFFRDEFPFFTVSPATLERHRQAMLYVGFDAERGEILSPRKYAENPGIDNAPLIDELETIVRYIAVNKRAGVFRRESIEAYKRLNHLAADDEGDRVTLLRLFYALVLRKPTGLMGEKPLDEVAQDVRRRHPNEADALAAEWTKIGRTLAGETC